MDDRNNTIAGWTLAAFGAALGLAIVGGKVFHSGEPTKEGYPVIAAAGPGGGDAATPEVPIAALLGHADAAKGADVFKKCSACHTINQGGANGVGPNLYAVVGDAVAVGRGYDFSGALKGVAGKWDFDKLNAWLTSPRKFADGTKMTFAGLSNEQDRANVILYLNQQGSNQPLPPPPAAAAVATGPDAKTGGNAPGGAKGGAGAGAAPGATSAVNAVATDRRAATADIANTGTPAMGAPSVDPNATTQGAKVGK